MDSACVWRTDLGSNTRKATKHGQTTRRAWTWKIYRLAHSPDVFTVLYLRNKMQRSCTCTVMFKRRNLSWFVNRFFISITIGYSLVYSKRKLKFNNLSIFKHNMDRSDEDIKLLSSGVSSWVSFMFLVKSYSKVHK